MRTPKLKFYFLSSAFLAFGLLLFNCAGFQNANYYQSDGIYGDKIVVVKKTEKSNGIYYKQYFQNLGDDYSSVTDDAVYFTDAEAYANPVDNEIQPAGQIPWGGQTTSTDIYVLNNQPALGLGFNNYGWGFSNFNAGFDPYYYSNGGRFRPFNPYGYNPYLGFGYNNPFFRFGFRNRFFNPWWNGYSPFYNPFFNGYAGLHYRPNYYRNYYNNRFFRNNRAPYYNSAYSGLSKGRRGEKGYQNSRDRINRNDRAENSRRKNNDFAVRASVNRLNIGRGSMYLGGLPASGEQFRLDNKFGSANAPSSILRNVRNLRQYGVTKSQAVNVNRQGRKFSQSRYSAEPAVRNARAVRRTNNTARQNNVSRQNYSTRAQPSSSNYSRSSGSSYRSGSATRSSGTNRSSSSSRGSSSGRRN